MKGESNTRRGILSAEDAEAIAVEMLGRLAAEPDRLSRFMSLSGLDAASIRDAAGQPGFLPAVLDYVAADEPLLLAIATELDHRPERLIEARRRLSPEPDWSA